MINISSIYSKLKKSYSKHLPEFLALKNRLYPEFVFESNPQTLRDEIPVFTLHAVEASKFEEQLRFLFVNGYRTLSADEFHECIISSRRIPERSILLTFDDGWKNLHTVAYPLLKRYGMRAVCFIIPGLIKPKGEEHTPGVMVKEGTATRALPPDSNTLCTWDDISEMHQSGVIDFQSHSMSHHLIFTSPTIEDFLYPSFDCYAKNFNVPLLRINGEDNISRFADLGTPIYTYASRLSGNKRYFDDESLRNRCIERVKAGGREDFFKSHGWRKKLMSLVQNHRKKYGDSGCYETDDAVRTTLHDEIVESKLEIERRIPGKAVRHFCYPWWEGSQLALEISKNAGYLTNFWGVLPPRRTNRRGDDPYRTVRLFSEDYIFRLPGTGRKSLINILEERFSLNYGRFLSRLARGD